MSNIEGTDISIYYLQGLKDSKRQSRWNWPTQYKINTKYWKIWKKTISTIYLKPKTLILKQPLGIRTTTPQDHPQTWNTYSTPTYLYTREATTNRWNKYKKIMSSTPNLYDTTSKQRTQRP